MRAVAGLDMLAVPYTAGHKRLLRVRFCCPAKACRQPIAQWYALSNRYVVSQSSVDDNVATSENDGSDASSTRPAITPEPRDQEHLQVTAPSDDDADKDTALLVAYVAAAEAALQSFVKAAAEVFRLAILLPLRYLVVSPLGWALSRLSILSPNPSEVLGRLDEANAASPVDASRVASVLRVLNKHHPQSVVDFVESRGMLLGMRTEGTADEISDSKDNGAGQGSNYAADVAVVREYLIALVKSGRIKDFGAQNQHPVVQGQSHRSLPLLLKQLQAAAEGTPAPAAPGAAAAWPLHVVMHGSVATAEAPAGPLQAIRSAMWFLLSIVFFTVAWTVGATAARRYAPGGMSSGISGGSMPGVSVGNSASSMFAPKEYSKENLPEKSVKMFSDVKGCDEAITELQEIVAYLKHPERFTKLGGKLPKGVLLTGPPGAGKTLLARAVAGEAGVPFFYKSGSEFDEMFVGVGSRRVRSLFAAAKKKAPCIVFIDEIDAVGGKRTNWESSGGSRKTLNQLLTDMDGFEENSGVVVMAATNLPELLDAALTRPGRFDRQVAVPLPDVNGRRQILELYLKDKPVANDVDADNLARRTPGFSGAQLSNLINEAALLAARHDATEISASLLDEAKDKVLMGSPRALAQSDEARRLTAYHEGGHALVALHTPGAKPIHKATIVPRGHALGMVMQLPDKDEYSTTKQQMMAHIDVCMGGKAAEELIFGADMVTSGATSDIRTATRLARHMMEDCGMSAKLGPVALGVREIGEGAVELSEDARRAVDQEVAALLKDAYARVAALLRQREAELHRLAGALLERETLTLMEIKELLGFKAEISGVDVAISPASVPGKAYEGQVVAGSEPATREAMPEDGEKAELAAK